MKNIIVTGGSKGIGRCIVENLAIEGNNVLLNYNKSEKEALKIQEELKEKELILKYTKQMFLNVMK
jgi:3-oxoacyl-[acyl-carrier protein] reductase